MKYRELGRTQLKVSEIGFGAWAIGGDAYGPTSDKDSLRALEAAWDRGVNFFDTADSYGKGHSEALLAAFLKGKSRDRAVIATKAGWDFYQAPVRKRFDAGYLGFAVERSLQRLDTDVLDLFQLHNPPLELIENGEAVSVLESLKQAGKIRFAGLSVHRVEEAMAALKHPAVDSLQVVFNVLDPRMKAVFEKAAEKRVALIAREPLASGLLSGKYPAGFEFPKGDHRRRWVSEKRQADAQKTALIFGLFPELRWPKTALEFVLAQDAFAVVIPGMKNEAQVLDNLSASEKPELTALQRDAFERLFSEEPVFKQGLNPS